MLKNWKTTAAGLALAVLNLVVMGYANGTITKENIGTSVIAAVLGFLAKDYDKTGIGKNATSDPTRDATIPKTIFDKIFKP